MLIGAGDHHETINVTRSAPLTLLGQHTANTLLTPTNASALPNLVRISNNSFVHAGQDDASSAVLVVLPNAAGALTGFSRLAPLSNPISATSTSGQRIYSHANYAISQALVTDISYANASFYGCSFASYQGTWYTGRNGSTAYIPTYANYAISQALVTDISYANASFYGCSFASYQGTWYTGRNGSTYVVDSIVYGQTDCTSPDANATTVTAGECYLGRPWNDLAATVYLNVSMDASINPAGFKPFSSGGVIANTTFYAEYNSTALGGGVTRTSLANAATSSVRLVLSKISSFMQCLRRGSRTSAVRELYASTVMFKHRIWWKSATVYVCGAELGSDFGGRWTRWLPFGRSCSNSAFPRAVPMW
ncbi:hypothetical protein PUNSTDRAFT_125138 [Punctularia strigosozonata HHB-11173 SS5]|uniref:uncharacterized protein n=1 Tax=Punctularia strigosozonata (strain HHB-11173) TaxID=741275 RepID=UPI00044179C0|nr:uncharacterized protein PUNSTDRAFT_125138 [Punctularia strigosozonata HHB-11173 SS5]EIN10131.1 hypothetical protein PUNSTDRAFT_125138 [Punctularia strigosozonata HHB-11173 SS5]